MVPYGTVPLKVKTPVKTSQATEASITSALKDFLISAYLGYQEKLTKPRDTVSLKKNLENLT